MDNATVVSPAAGAREVTVPAGKMLTTAVKWLVVVVLAASVPLWMPAYWVSVCSQAAVLSVAVLSITVLYRSTGAISLCQASFMGIAGYSCSWFAGHAGLSLTLSMILGVLVTVTVGVLLALPALRLRGLELTVLTVTFALAANAIVFNSSAPLAVEGTSQQASISASAKLIGLDVTSGQAQYWMVGCIALVVFGATALVLSTRTGRVWLAMAAGQRAVWANGISVTKYKLLGFTIGAGVAAVAGIMSLLLQRTIVSSSFDVPQSITLAVFAILVGTETLIGAMAAGSLIAGGAEVLEAFGLSGNLVNTVVGFLAILAIVFRARRIQEVQHA